MPQAALAAVGAGLSSSVVTTFGLGIWSAALTTAGINYAFAELGSRFAPDPQLGERELPGTQLTFRDPQASRETVYGTTRKGGPIVFMAPSGVDNEWLHLVIVLASHECEELGDAYFNGVSEHELLHTNTHETINVIWSRTFIFDQGGGTTGAYPSEFSVILEGLTFTGASVQSLADQINAHPDIHDISATKITTQRPGAQQYIPLDDTLQLIADTNDRDRIDVQAQDSIESCRIYIDHPLDEQQDAFKIWRHTGSETQPADAELVRLFSTGRKARVVVRWESDRDTLNLTINDRQITGTIQNIIDYVQSDTLGQTITVRKQSTAELVFEHISPGAAIVVSSSNSDFSREIAETAVPAWTVAHQGKGLCYAHVRLARRSDVWGNQAPNITFDVKGKRLRDTRTGTDVFTDNWALVIRDYLKTFCAVPDSRLNDAEFSIAATICDEAVTLDDDGKTQARYTMNGIVQESQSPGQVLSQMQNHGGRILRRRGMWTVSPWVDQPPIAPLFEEEHVSVPQITLGHSHQDSFNTVVATYSAEDTGWQSSPAPPVTNSLYVTEDNGKELKRSIDLRFSDGSYRSQRLSRIALEEHRQGITVKINVPIWRVDCEEGRVLPLWHSRWGWEGKLFMIERAVARIAAEPSDGEYRVDGGLELTLREYAPGAYDWNRGLATLTDLAPNSNLSPARYVEAPLGLLVSTVPAWHTTDSNSAEFAKVLASWRAPVQSDVSHYEIEWRSGDAPAWTPTPTTRTHNVVIGPVPDTSAIDVRVRAVGMQGRRSRWATVSDVPVNSVASLVGLDGSAVVTQSQTAPSNPDDGDIWLETDAQDNIINRWFWKDGAWTDVSESRIATAIASAFTVESLVDGVATVYFQDSTSVPVANGTGDLWVQPNTKKILVWNGTSWELSSSLEWEDILGAGKAEDNAANTGDSPIPDPHFMKEDVTSGQFWQYGDGSAVQLVMSPRGGKGALIQADAKLITKHQFPPHESGYYEFRLRAHQLDVAKDVAPQCFVRFHYADDTHLDVSLSMELFVVDIVSDVNNVFRGFATGVTSTKVPVGISYGVWNQATYPSGDPSRLVVDSISVIEPTRIVHIDSNRGDYRDANGAMKSPSTSAASLTSILSMFVTPFGTGISGSGNFKCSAYLELQSLAAVYNNNEPVDARILVQKRISGVFQTVFDQVVATEQITQQYQTLTFDREFVIPNFTEQLVETNGDIINDYQMFWQVSLRNAASYPDVGSPPAGHPYNAQVVALRYILKVSEPLST